MAKTPTKTKQDPRQDRQEAKPRRLKKPSYKSFKLSQRIKGDKLPGAFRIMKDSLQLIGRNWKIFAGIALIYCILNIVLVQGFSAAGDLGGLKSQLDKLFAGNIGGLASGFTLFVYLIGSSGSKINGTAGAYLLMITLVISLAIIWSLRQIYSGSETRVRDSFYRGMAPLVQFVLVLLVIILELIPMTLGLMLFSTVTANGIAVSFLEQIMWAMLAFVLSLLSLYMVSSSIFAMYIVTLPDMTPMKALRSARQLVVNRRWGIIRKILLLMIALLILAAILVIPVIIYATSAAAWLFFLLTILLLPVVHSYMYTLYRSML